MKNLVFLRKKIGKTQKDIADHLGISRQAYAHYETDNREPDMKTIKQLSDYFNVSSDIVIDRYELTESSFTSIQIFSKPFSLNAEEEFLVSAYRAHQEMHEAVHRILDIKDDEQPLRVAAAPNVNPAIINLDSDEISHT